ncbi:MAG: signal peptidase I [Actinobacteria bacterium]|nr:signal peptidase I [Actinomycetota bacterium]
MSLPDPASDPHVAVRDRAAAEDDEVVRVEGVSEPDDDGRLARLIPNRSTRLTVEWVGLLAVALLIAVLLRTFVVQSFYIPSESMEPTLLRQDRVLVNKLAYRFGDPGRGDVVVFEAPPGQGSPEVKDLIKRVIGLPGDTIEGREGRIYINGKPLREPWLPEGTQSKTFGPQQVPDGKYFVLGDNRPNSRDSTVFNAIPRESIVGKAFLRFLPLSRFGTL